MIVDLSDCSNTPIPRADICIVGAGIVGITVAYFLRQQGKRVVLVDRGGALATRQDVGGGLEQPDSAYSGGTMGRAFGLGGTSSLWGGQIVATSNEDRAARPWLGVDSWPIPDAEIRSAYEAAAAWLKIPAEMVIPESGEQSPLGNIGIHFLRRHAFSLGFSKRNFAEFQRPMLLHDPDLVVMLNARAIKLAKQEIANVDQEVTSILLRDPRGVVSEIHADQFVVAAGAIETTRLLMQVTNSMTNVHPCLRTLGTGFRDHISMPVGTFRVKDRAAFLTHIAPRFDSRGILHPRFELAHRTQREFGLPSAFLHVVAKSNGNTVFDALRRLLAMWQARHFPLTSLGANVAQLFASPIELARTVVWRLLKNVLYYPAGHDFILQIDLEQVPSTMHRIELGAEEDDAGVRKVRIAWSVGGVDHLNARTIAALFEKAWNESPMAEGATLVLDDIPVPEVSGGAAPAYDVFHPVGSAACGADSLKTGVTPDLCVRGFSNLFTVSTAVLPSSGSANPTFSAIALGIRLANHVSGLQCNRDAPQSAT